MQLSPSGMTILARAAEAKQFRRWEEQTAFWTHQPCLCSLIINLSLYITCPMCGIFCSISRNSHVSPDQQVLHLLQRRGPDSTACARLTFDANTADLPSSPINNAYLTFTSTVLSLRGAKTVGQPLQDADESCLLCWNGEAWSISGQPTFENDTEAVYNLLSRGAKQSHSAGLSAKDAAAMVSQNMATVAGPYAFLFYDAHAGRIYLGRDFLGRRSLLWKTNENGDILISSITSGSLNGSWAEIEADGIYCIDLRRPSYEPGEPKEGHTLSSDFAVYKVPYHTSDSRQQDDNHSVGNPSSLWAAHAHGKVGHSISFSQSAISIKL